jgi:hypothetical protein
MVGLGRMLVDDAIDELYKVDFLEEELFRLGDIKRPSLEILSTLEKEARQQRRQHHDLMEAADYKKSASARKLGEEHWECQARSPLFRSKRALALAQLLRVRMIFRRFLGKLPTKEGLINLAQAGEGREAISRVVRQAKADRVGTAIADINICGAIPPYNEMLGGKLVALLLGSPEVVEEYRRRYGKVPSVIASSMAGRAMTRPAHLVFLGTTSLYGRRPCQYDRISFPGTADGSSPGVGLRYEYLGRTEGLGTFQFGKRTVAALTPVLSQSKGGQRVNSVFGEGVNPRLRKLRDGLEELGLSADIFLRHGSPRLVYGLSLIHNVHEYLLSMEKHPRYILSQKNAALMTEQMCNWWMKRWVVGRIQRDDVLDRMARQTLVHPIRHGARVVLPRTDLEQPELFEDWSG